MMYTATLVIGAVLGALLAWGASRLMSTLSPPTLPPTDADDAPTPQMPPDVYDPPDFLGDADAEAEELLEELLEGVDPGDDAYMRDFVERALADETL